MTKLAGLSEIKTLFHDGLTLMVGGFGLVGSPLCLIETLCESGAESLTIVSNNLGEQGKGLGRLVLERRVGRAIGSFFTSNPDVVRAHLDGEIEVELIPQGTLAEAIRAAGVGLGGFYVPTGVGTELTRDKEIRNIRGKDFVFQEPLHADIALVKAYQADEFGNLIYRKSARNFNPLMAMAASFVVAEVDEIVPVGQLNPEEIVTPHLFVDKIVLSGGA